MYFNVQSSFLLRYAMESLVLLHELKIKYIFKKRETEAVLSKLSSDDLMSEPKDLFSIFLLLDLLCFLRMLANYRCWYA